MQTGPAARLPATPRVIDALVQQQRSGAAATKADASWLLAELSTKWNRCSRCDRAAGRAAAARRCRWQEVRRIGVGSAECAAADIAASGAGSTRSGLALKPRQRPSNGQRHACDQRVHMYARLCLSRPWPRLVCSRALAAREVQVCRWAANQWRRFWHWSSRPCQCASVISSCQWPSMPAAD